MEKQELIKELNDLSIVQSSGDWCEDLSDKMWEDNFQHKKQVTTGLDVDTRRHYETSISVYNMGDWLLGVRHISNIFSENSDVEGCYVKLSFFEMEETKVVTYKQK
jgi:hypothetical protein